MADLPYPETVSRTGEVDYIHKKDLFTSHAQYARVKLRLQPLNRGEGFSFTSEIGTGVLPTKWISSIERGVLGAAKSGVLNGGEVVDCRATLFDGAYHDIDSSDQAFYTAAQEAFWQAMRKASPKILLYR